jgi:hypothetical protein
MSADREGPSIAIAASGAIALPEQSDNAGVLVSFGETDSIAEGMRAVELFTKSARDYVEACVVILRMVQRYAHGSPELEQFTSVLVASKHLSEKEASRGPKSGKLSKLCKIGEHSCHSACNIDPLSRGIGVQN